MKIDSKNGKKIYINLNPFPTGYYEYNVYPLEGLWDMSDAGRAFESFNTEVRSPIHCEIY